MISHKAQMTVLEEELDRLGKLEERFNWGTDLGFQLHLTLIESTEKIRKAISYVKAWPDDYCNPDIAESLSKNIHRVIALRQFLEILWESYPSFRVSGN